MALVSFPLQKEELFGLVSNKPRNIMIIMTKSILISTSKLCIIFLLFNKGTCKTWKNTKTALTLHYSYPDCRDFSQAGKSQLTSFLELEVSGRNIIHIKLNLLIQVLIYLLTAVNFVYFKTIVFCNYGLSWLTWLYDLTRNFPGLRVWLLV